MLEAVGVSCGYAGKPVVQEVGLYVRTGELVSLIGPNGAGKSTLLRTLTGYLPALRGEVLLEGRPVRSFNATDRARRIAYVPQREPPVFDFSVREVVRMGRTPYGDEESAHEIVDAALHALDLVQLADRPVTQLSGGELQRTLIARSLAQSATLMLLDEPSAHLDPGHQARVMSLLRARCEQKDKPCGVLCVLQDLNLASTFSHRLLLLYPGGPLVDGSPEEILKEERLRELYGPAVSVLPRDGTAPLVVVSRIDA